MNFFIVRRKKQFFKLITNDSDKRLGYPINRAMFERLRLTPLNTSAYREYMRRYGSSPIYASRSRLIHNKLAQPWIGDRIK